MAGERHRIRTEFAISMLWQEKIEKLKKATSLNDFDIPFTDWSAILKRIEGKYIVKENSNYIFSNWSRRLKNKQTITEFRQFDLSDELKKLNITENYWLIVVGKNADAKNLVYDCKPNVILKLTELWPDDFYIVEKKYNWLTFFERSKDLKIIVYKSGTTTTPWG
jgi:hypothetical protein